MFWAKIFVLIFLPNFCSSQGYNEEYTKKMFDIAASAYSYIDGVVDNIESCANVAFGSDLWAFKKAGSGGTPCYPNGECSYMVVENLSRMTVYVGISTVGNNYDQIEQYLLSNPKMTPFDNKSIHGKVNADFLAYAQANQFFTGILADYLQDDDWTVTFTGHSLGGAVASLIAYGFARQADNAVQLYTFGEPRVGDYNFSDVFSGYINYPNTFRIVHNQDPIPHLPHLNMSGVISYGYFHIPQEIWYANGNSTSMGNTVPNICAMYNGEDPKCSDSLTNIDFSKSGLVYHQYYFDKNVYEYGRSGCKWGLGTTTTTTVITPTSACVDIIDDCSLYITHCNQTKYHDILCQNCQKTCKLCGQC